MGEAEERPVHQLETQDCLVEISDHGAELSRIYDKRNERELLWSADPAFWNRHAPVLFPFVGAAYQNVYHYNGKEYPMKQHGFARDMEFELVKITKDRVIHRLVSSDETRKIYPFDFCLTIVHALKDNILTVEWVVDNLTDGEMYFTIGGHPAFMVDQGSRLIAAGKEKRIFIRINEAGTALPQQYELNLPEGRMPLKEDTFCEGVYIFEDGQLSEAGLEGPDGNMIVTIRCPGFPYFGVWSKPGAPFVCLEPWVGRTDDTGFSGDLSEKTGVQKLEKGGKFRISYDIVVGK